MITGGKKWHYVGVSCLNCLHSHRTENKFKKHYNVC